MLRSLNCNTALVCSFYSSSSTSTTAQRQQIAVTVAAASEFRRVKRAQDTRYAPGTNSSTSGSSGGGSSGCRHTCFLKFFDRNRTTRGEPVHEEAVLDKVVAFGLESNVRKRLRQRK